MSETTRMTGPMGPPPAPPPGPIAQSVAIGFRTVYVAGAAAGGGLAVSNVREIASDSQAVVMRFGRIVRVQDAGLLLAWPRPIEQVQPSARARTAAEPGGRPLAAGGGSARDRSDAAAGGIPYRRRLPI